MDLTLMEQINENRKAEKLLRDGEPDYLDWGAVYAYNAKETKEKHVARKSKKSVSDIEVVGTILATCAIATTLIYIFTF